MREVCRLFSLVPDLEVATREYEVRKRFEVCVNFYHHLCRIPMQIFRQDNNFASPNIFYSQFSDARTAFPKACECACVW